MEEKLLVEQIRADDQKAIATVYSLYRPDFIRWIRRFAQCDSDDADEYFQASVVIFYDNLRTGKIVELRSTIKTFLYGVGKKLVWQHNRKSMRHQKVCAEYFLVAHVQPDPETESFLEFELELVSHCFEQLGDPCHKLLELFYYQQKKLEEICSHLGYKNVETAKNQKYKCMERLRKMVQNERTQKVTD